MSLQRNMEDQIIKRAYTILTNRLHEATIRLSSNLDVEVFLQHRLMSEEREIFGAIWLNVKNRVIACEVLALGTLVTTRVYPRETVKSAMKNNAASVIFFHNHPSGDAIPSETDKEITVVMIEALALVDVRVLDHFIVAGEGVYSFAQSGILNEIRNLWANKNIAR